MDRLLRRSGQQLAKACTSQLEVCYSGPGAAPLQSIIGVARCRWRGCVSAGDRCASTAASPPKVQVGISVSCMTHWSPDYVVMIRRATPPAAGHWSYPGGRMIWGETIAQAAIRELSEEAGITAAVVDERAPAFTATDAIYLSEGFHYVVVHVLATTTGHAGVSAASTPATGQAQQQQQVLPALVSGDDASEAVWAHIDVPGSRCSMEQSSMRHQGLLAAHGRTKVVSLAHLIATDTVVPLAATVALKAQKAMVAHLTEQSSLSTSRSR